jgi:HemY protein
MVKFISLLLVFVLIIVFGYWLSVNSGELVFSILGYQIETSVMVALITIIAFTLAALFITNLLKKILSFPASVRTYFIERKITNLISIQRQLILEMAAENVGQIKAVAAKLAKLTEDKAFAEVCLLLSANSDRKSDIEKIFSKATSSEARQVFDTILLNKSIQESNWISALSILERIWSRNKTSYVMNNIIKVYIYLGMWKELGEFVYNNINYMDRNQVTSIRAIASYNLAKEMVNNNMVDQAFESLAGLIKQEPNFHYAMILLIEIAIKSKIKSKVLNLVRTHFARHQCPEVTIAILRLSGLFSNDKLYDFALNLHRDNNESIESKIILAQFSINAGMYDQAFREISHCLSVQGKTARLCLLMAEFCQRTQGNVGEALDWIKSSMLSESVDLCSKPLYLDLNTLTLVNIPGYNTLELCR